MKDMLLMRVKSDVFKNPIKIRSFLMRTNLLLSLGESDTIKLSVIIVLLEI